MIIFNNGKYKSILAAEAGELTKITETVQKDKDFRPHFHIIFLINGDVLSLPILKIF